MVSKTSLDDPRLPPHGNGHRQSAAAGVREGVGELLSDIVSLGELQTQLVAVDAKESMHKAQTPLILFGVGAVLGLGAVPVLLLALGELFYHLLIEYVDWARPLGYLLSGLIGAAIAGLLLYLASRQVGGVVSVFRRSTDELSENVRWVKYALTRGRRPPRSPNPNP